jgi:hypothetical protein
MAEFGHILLWDVIDRTFETTKEDALADATSWPGYPKNPIDPNPININYGIQNYAPFHGKNIPDYPLFGRKTSRAQNGGYVSLSNYNVLP